MSVFGVGSKVIAFGVVIPLLGFFTACATAEPIKQEASISVADITSNPTEYEGKTVTLSGEYRGWEAGYGSPPVTRSDWVLKDTTGAIHVTGKMSTGLDPMDDRGKTITVDGIVKVKEGQAYIEAQTIR